MKKQTMQALIILAVLLLIMFADNIIFPELIK